VVTASGTREIVLLTVQGGQALPKHERYIEESPLGS
jgi:hypothetical protein